MASSLLCLERFEEARSLMRKTIPVARRALGECNEATLGITINYARALYKDQVATLDDLREAVTAVEETERTARQVLGSKHPLTLQFEGDLQESRKALRARESPPPPGTE